MFDGLEVIAEINCWVAERKKKNMEEQFSDRSIASLTPPIGWHRPKKYIYINENYI